MSGNVSARSLLEAQRHELQERIAAALAEDEEVSSPLLQWAAPAATTATHRDSPPKQLGRRQSLSKSLIPTPRPPPARTEGGDPPASRRGGRQWRAPAAMRPAAAPKSILHLGRCSSEGEEEVPGGLLSPGGMAAQYVGEYSPEKKWEELAYANQPTPNVERLGFTAGVGCGSDYNEEVEGYSEYVTPRSTNKTPPGMAQVGNKHVRLTLWACGTLPARAIQCVHVSHPDLFIVSVFVLNFASSALHAAPILSQAAHPLKSLASLEVLRHMASGAGAAPPPATGPLGFIPALHAASSNPHHTFNHSRSARD